MGHFSITWMPLKEYTGHQWKHFLFTLLWHQVQSFQSGLLSSARFLQQVMRHRQTASVLSQAISQCKQCLNSPKHRWQNGQTASYRFITRVTKQSHSPQSSDVMVMSLCTHQHTLTYLKINPVSTNFRILPLLKEFILTTISFNFLEHTVLLCVLSLEQIIVKKNSASGNEDFSPLKQIV